MPFMARWMTMCMLLWVIPDSPTIQWYVTVYMHVCACRHSSLRACVHVCMSACVHLFVEYSHTISVPVQSVIDNSYVLLNDST